MRTFPLPTRHRPQCGFTLLDLSLSLLIFSLVTAAILRGEEMINGARIKSVITDYNGVRIALSAYKDRYAALPGDDNDTTRWSIAGVAPVGGNRDGKIDGEYNALPASPPTAAQESNLFWWHLRLAGLMIGAADAADGARPPLNFAGGITGVQAQTTLGLSGLVMCSANLGPRIAAGVDVQSDDGDGQTGEIRAMRNAGGNPSIPPALLPQSYDESGSNFYVVCGNINR